MEEQVQILDKTFARSISEQEIAKAVTRIATQISNNLREKDPVFIVVLNGAFMFAADLMKELNFPSRITFVKMASYEGTASTGIVRELIGLSENIEGRMVVIIEDIVDTGYTMQRMIAALQSHRPKEIHIASLFMKPDNLKVDLHVDYVAFHIPNDFIVGYGLDYEGYGRNLSAIYSVVE